MKKVTPLYTIFLIVTCIACNSDSNPAPIEQGEKEIEENALSLINAFPNISFNRPVDLQSPDDGTQRIFVVEQRGVIRSFPNETDISETGTFLDIENRVDDNASEQGLLGLAFHPDFDINGFFYINYNPSPVLSRISRFRVDASFPDSADPDSETVLLEFSQPYRNHNGGQLAFGPDGYLYIATGDGGDGGDPLENGQDLTTLLGAILRIDVNATEGSLNYAIPGDNPFVNTAGARGEIFAYGLRNPWRMSFDKLTGLLWAADVGQGRVEEIDIIEHGKNYGWNIMEGSTCFQGTDCPREQLMLPVYEYSHSDNNASVTGGYVYRGEQLASLQGRYVYGDFNSGRIWALSTSLGNPLMNDLLEDTNLNISSFGTDANDELFICSLNGAVYKFKEN